MIISKTPYRLSFFGGGTDYNSWFEKNGGLILAVSIAHYCYINVRSLPPFFDHKHRIVYSKTEQVKKIREIEHPSVKACLEHLNIKEGIEIHYNGDLPARSGIGSSSAFTVGLLNALSNLRGAQLTKIELAKKAIFVEQKLLQESVGVQDQIMSSLGGFQVLQLNQSSSWKNKKLQLSDDYTKLLEKSILFGFSGVSRLADKHAKRKIENIKENRTFNELSRIYAIAKEAKTLFEKEADFDLIGQLLDYAWKEKRMLAKGVTNNFIDEIYQVAIENGAVGGKLMGAGGGGFFFFIAHPKHHNKIKEKLHKIKVWVPFKIDNFGTKIIFRNNKHNV